MSTRYLWLITHALWLSPSLYLGVSAQDQWPRWCGKHYKEGSPADSQVVISGRTPVPSQSATPLLAFSCRARMYPYLHNDTSLSILLNANITFDVGQAIPGGSSTSDRLNVTVFLQSNTSDPIMLNSTVLPLGTLGYDLSINSDQLSPSLEPYNISCVATLIAPSAASGSPNSTFTDSARLYRLPENPYNGSVTKMDRKTGGMLRLKADGTWAPFLPFGFYTFTYDILSNLTIIDSMVKDGYNFIHLVPPYPDPDGLLPLLQRADSKGLLYMADFRDSYKNLTSIVPYIQLFQSRKNLLAWYTTDEPDGPGDDPQSAVDAYNLFYDMDRYHPVALVLNCADYRWNEYTSGADIVLSDVYPIAVNTTYSKRYHTVCNATYGCCGCDDCSGQYSDISTRLDVWSERRRWLGRSNDMAFWNVPQAFNGTAEFWDRVPTGNEFILQTVLSLNHGAVGIMPWDNPYDTPGIAQSAREIASILTGRIGSIILDPTSTRVALNTNDSMVDASAWVVNQGSKGQSLLILAANLHPESSTSATIDFGSLITAVGNFSASDLVTLFGADGSVRSNQGHANALAVPMQAASASGYVVTLKLSTAGGGDGKNNGSEGNGSASIHASTLWTIVVIIAVAFACHY